MSIAALGWLGSKMGIDMTGETAQEEGQPEKQGLFDKVGSAVFGGADEEQLPPDSGWGYEYNSDTGMHHPTDNAPEHIKAEFENRVKEMNAPPKEVAPPPMMSDVQFKSAANVPKYASVFDSYSPGQAPPSETPPGGSPLNGQNNSSGYTTPSQAPTTPVGVGYPPAPPPAGGNSGSIGGVPPLPPPPGMPPAGGATASPQQGGYPPANGFQQVPMPPAPPSM